MSEIERAVDVEEYSRHPLLRALIQMTPGVGNAIDNLLTGHAAELQQKRVMELIAELEKSFAALDAASVQYADFNSEEGADLLMICMRSAARHRSKKRLKALADVITKRSKGFGTWDEAESAALAIDQLYDIDLFLLSRMDQIRMREGPFSGEHAFLIGDRQIMFGTRIHYPEGEPKNLKEDYPKLEGPRIRLSVFRLKQLGYVRELNSPERKITGDTYFAFTEEARWLAGWLDPQRLS